MRVQRLKIENFRTIKKADFDFSESNLTVFIGVNGAGKSSLIDMISIFLDGAVSSLFATKKSDLEMHEKDISRGSRRSSGAIFLSDNAFFSSIATVTCIPLENFAERISFDHQKLTPESNLPILLAFNSKRYFNVANKGRVNRIFKASQKEAFRNAFTARAIGFEHFSSWFRELEDKENEHIIRTKDFDYKSTLLNIVRKSIETFFKFMTGAEFDSIKVLRTAPGGDWNRIKWDDTMITVSKNGQEFDLNELSSGEKNLLVLVCDIARRLAIANPAPENGTALEGTGIVLIDEIELHLHPKWQREVIPALRATFPNIQFIVTTHSPQVLSRVDGSDVFVIEDGEVFNLESSPKGRDSNTILEEIMDTSMYPTAEKALIEDLFRQIQHKNFDAARRSRQLLVEATDADHPVLARADAMMERL